MEVHDSRGEADLRSRGSAKHRAHCSKRHSSTFLLLIVCTCLFIVAPESNTLKCDIVAANSTGVEGWKWIEETSEERNRRMRRNEEDAPAAKSTIDFVYKFVDSSQGEHSHRKRYWESRLRALDALGPGMVSCPAIDRQKTLYEESETTRSFSMR